MLRWTALDLAAASKVGVAKIRRVEGVDGEIPLRSPTKQRYGTLVNLLASSSSKGTGPAKAFDFASRKNRGESQTMFGFVTTDVAAFNE
jgi:hypothetical protein